MAWSGIAVGSVCEALQLRPVPDYMSCPEGCTTTKRQASCISDNAYHCCAQRARSLKNTEAASRVTQQHGTAASLRLAAERVCQRGKLARCWRMATCLRPRQWCILQRRCSCLEPAPYCLLPLAAHSSAEHLRLRTLVQRKHRGPTHVHHLYFIMAPSIVRAIQAAPAIEPSKE